MVLTRNIRGARLGSRVARLLHAQPVGPLRVSISTPPEDPLLDPPRVRCRSGIDHPGHVHHRSPAHVRGPVISWAETETMGSMDTGAVRLDADALLERARLQHASDGSSFEATQVELRVEPDAPVLLRSGRDRLYLDAYTGEVRGTESPAAATLMSDLRGWHRWLAMEGDSRAIGRGITGACNLAFLVLVLTGMVLWLPQRFRWQHFKAVLAPKLRVSGKARDFNWHNSLGIWSALPLVLIVFSGAWISYDWIGDLVNWAVPEEAPASVASGSSPAPKPISSAMSSATSFAATSVSAEGLPFDPNFRVSTDNYSDVVQAALARHPDWNVAVLRPADSLGRVSVQVREGYRGQSPESSTWVGSVGETYSAGVWTDFDDLPRQRRVRSLLRFGHTGEYWGLAGQTVAGLVTLATLILVWTGIALSLRRLRQWARRRSRVTTPS